MLASSRRPWREERLRFLLSQPFRGSRDEPPSLVNIEFHQAFVSHFQQQRLAGFLIHDIGPFHDLVDFERLLAECAQDIFSIIQHDCSLQNRDPQARISRLHHHEFDLTVFEGSRRKRVACHLFDDRPICEKVLLRLYLRR
jgi:hypothetical protein